MRQLFVAAAMLASVAVSPAAEARKKPVAAWQVMHATDPITRASTCAVVASDYVGKMRFTRIGAFYPVVEKNSTYGLLVGVSSGGRYRLPTGDILWAVDDLPHHEIRVADNPGAQVAITASGAAGALESVTAFALQVSRNAVATSTMASGTKARELLGEMLTGKTLLFRSAAMGPQTGLPDYSALMAGQVNEKGQLNPIPLDASFHEGLRACGIVDEQRVSPEAGN